MNLENFSPEFDDFAAITKASDGIITVDTVTAHLSDCFDVPTIVMFTTIEPKYRISYYPYAKGIMMEKKGGKIYGRHKFDFGTKEFDESQEYVDKLWKKTSVKEVVSELNDWLIHTKR